MRVEVWSDVVCPWCYIGKRHLETALAGFDRRSEVDLVWRSFELDPSAPRERPGRYVDRLARKYGCPVSDAQTMIDRMTAAAAAVGVGFRFDIARPGATYDAHRLLHLARQRGVQDRLKERLLAATFCEGESIGDRMTLVRLAEEAGIDAAVARAALDSGAFADEVRADEAEAGELGIGGVPYFVIDRIHAVSGAQPPEVLARALERAWRARRPEPLRVSDVDPRNGCNGTDCAV